MNLYAETSAVLSWLLEEGRGNEARQALARADRVFTSDLTLIECDRVLHRAAATGRLDEAAASEIRTAAATASAYWTLCAIDVEVVEAARRRFPQEPVRSLDAIHLATALAVRSMAPDACVLSLDDRVRGNSLALGFDVVPAQATA